MTDEEYQKLEAEFNAAWTAYQTARDQADKLADVWMPLYQRLEKAKLRRTMLAEIAAEKGQA